MRKDACLFVEEGFGIWEWVTGTAEVGKIFATFKRGTFLVEYGLHSVRIWQFDCCSLQHLLYGLSPGRRVQRIWIRGIAVSPTRSWGTVGPNVTSLPTHHEMYFSFVWSIREYPALWYALHSRLEYSQREDIHCAVVLVGFNFLISESIPFLHATCWWCA